MTMDEPVPAQNACPLARNPINIAKDNIRMTMLVEPKAYESILAEAKEEGLNLKFRRFMPKKDIIELQRRITLHLLQGLLTYSDTMSTDPIDLGRCYREIVEEGKQKGLDLTPRKELTSVEVESIFKQVGKRSIDRFNKRQALQRV